MTDFDPETFQTFATWSLVIGVCLLMVTMLGCLGAINQIDRSRYVKCVFLCLRLGLAKLEAFFISFAPSRTHSPFDSFCSGRMLLGYYQILIIVVLIIMVRLQVEGMVRRKKINERGTQRQTR